MCLYIPFYIIALSSFNYKVQFCVLKGDAQNLPLRRVSRGRSPPSSSQMLTGMQDNVTHIKISNKLTPSINYFLNLFLYLLNEDCRQPMAMSSFHQMSG